MAVLTIKCPSCATEGRVSFVNPDYEGPIRKRIDAGERLQKFSISQILMENFRFDTIPLRDLVEIIQTDYAHST